MSVGQATDSGGDGGVTIQLQIKKSAVKIYGKIARDGNSPLHSQSLVLLVVEVWAVEVAAHYCVSGPSHGQWHGWGLKI